MLQRLSLQVYGEEDQVVTAKILVDFVTFWKYNAFINNNNVTEDTMKAAKKQTIQQLASLRVTIPPNKVHKDKNKYNRKTKHRNQKGY